MRFTFAALAAALLATPGLAVGPTLESALETPASGRIITRSGVWTCDQDGCVSTSTASRPMIQCQLLVKEVGPATRFAVDGVAFDDDTLAKCNKKARQGGL